MRSSLMSITLFCYLLLVGCSHTYTISATEEFSLKKPAEVTTRDNEKLNVYNLQMDLDTLMARDVRTNDDLFIPRQNVEKIKVSKPLRAVLQGTALSTSLGVCVDILILSQFEIPIDGLGTLVGMLTGPIPSLLIGSKDYYIIESSEAVQSEFTTPLRESECTIQKSPVVIERSHLLESERSDANIYKNQILLGGSSDLAAMIIMQYRHNIKPVSLGMLRRVGINHSNYLSAGYSWGQGNENRIVDEQWHGSRLYLSYGTDILVIGSPIRSTKVYSEFGILRSSIQIIHNAGPRNDLGVIGIMGLRVNWNSFILETQISHDSVFRELYPHVLVGLRF